MPDDYEIGYRKPPKHTQFKPGQSGNPRGRPKKKSPGRVDVADVLNEPVSITQSGVRRKMAPFEASVRKLVQKGLNKDLNAILMFLKLSRKYGLMTPPPPAQQGGVVVAPKGVNFHEWLETVTELVPAAQEDEFDDL